MTEKNKPYRVLARKYRPQNFDELIGQDTLVRTLKNAITSGRVAHAFMLTGVRGVGKTTTARIIAKALNYIGPDGTSEPTINSTDDCPLCQAISEDRHPDVIEMDAASRTGVDDIREILDGVRYAPTEARYKIYVIDEVHMLSKNAFNALLKTLEEPPEHVKFIFATTEIRKVPITVLSRCQRFDLQRIDIDALSKHFTKICDLEKFTAEEDAIAMIARAADGSVRDGLSLLDQAMALSTDTITATQIQEMLGLADRAKNMDLLESALSGDMKNALEIMDHIHKNGGAPSVILQDLLDLTHLLTKLRAVPDLEEINKNLSSDQLARAKELSGKLSMPSLSKTWQILLKGLSEVNTAPNPQNAAEMVIIRLAYAANLPDPSDLIKRLKDQPTNTPAPQASTQASSSADGHASTSSVHTQDFTPPPQPTGGTIQASGNGQGQEVARATPMLSVVPEPRAATGIKTIEDIIALLEQNQEILLASQLYTFAHPIKIEQKRFEFRQQDGAMPDLSQRLTRTLKKITGDHWMVVISKGKGAPTLSEIEERRRLQELEDVAKTPMVSNILKIFPDARLSKILHVKENETEAETQN
ncbi:MAG: DNA polymerase III subunit gamma/tau [Zetaproteobacteria bacterium]|nr:MAG: DNA polymerase III subunit gamma/tau [Zetaproteobacteria bacterium]